MEERKFNDAGFYRYLRESRLMASHCTRCGALFVPPRPLCTRCYGAHMDWMELSGEGRLAGLTTIYVGLTAMVDAGYDREHPYSVGVVRLIEGPAVCGQILAPDGSAQVALRIGMPLQAAFVEPGGVNRRVTLAFRPVD